MSFRAIILLKSREAIYHRASAKKNHFKFQNGIYVITETDIQNTEVNGKIKGAEAIYFEGNPNAVGYEKFADSSSKYLDEIVIVNALKQTGSGPRFDFGSWLSYLAPLKDPVNLIYILFAGIIVYGLIAGALGWV
ncbi:hypothetical protein ES702_01940 [subsurface metagenome]